MLSLIRVAVVVVSLHRSRTVTETIVKDELDADSPTSTSPGLGSQADGPSCLVYAVLGRTQSFVHVRHVLCYWAKREEGGS